jgi:7,8-dihydropterin-6-yl-methyl-4-(beta-D-ribofuranosyl)aminobenzene 5'-phosphate synthase
VKNILETAKEIFNEGRIYAFIGGTHILDDMARTQEFISLMRDMDVRLVAPSHCTGVLSRVLIGRELPDRFVSLSTGEKILIEE